MKDDQGEAEAEAEEKVTSNAEEEAAEAIAKDEASEIGL